MDSLLLRVFRMSRCKATCDEPVDISLHFEDHIGYDCVHMAEDLLDTMAAKALRQS